MPIPTDPLSALAEGIVNLTKRIRALETRESTPLTVQAAAASADLSLTAANQDVAGATLNLSSGVYAVVGVFDFRTGNDDLDNGQTANGVLSINAVAQTGEAVMRLIRADANANERVQACVTQTWSVTVPSGSTYVAKLQARKSGGTGTSQALQTHTTITAMKLAVIG